MNTFLDFILLKNPNVIYVLLGVFFINTSAALIGTFAFLRKRALIGDAIAHSLLPGVCLGFLFAGEKNPLFLLLGAFATGWASTFLIDLVVNRTKTKQDTAIAIVLSTFFAFGIVLLTYIQKNVAGQHGGLDHFLFGQAAAIGRGDVILLGIIFLVIIGLLFVFFRSFLVLSFNADFARSAGLPVRTIEFLLTSLTVLAVASGIQALGVVLMSALIITPAAAARFWTENLVRMLLIAVVISLVCGIGGAYVSYSVSNMPTGPWVVVFLATITFLSIALSPKKGMLANFVRNRNNRRKILLENILKAIYVHHEERHGELELNYHLTSSEIQAMRNFDTAELSTGLQVLRKKGMLEISEDKYFLTDIGKKESKRVVRLHRLWEQYLLTRTNIATDHVHSGAEAIEHVLSPELEMELERELGQKGIPEKDY
jgi:manganese/zinc/iron transport system permease protein